MNGIQRIIDHIKADAASESAAIAAQADARCAEIRAEFERAKQAEYQKILKDGTKRAEQHLERRASVTVLEAKKQVLTTKQEMVGAAFERAAQLLSDLPNDQYIPLLARLASEAARTGHEQLAFSPRDAKNVGEAVKDAANNLLRLSGLEASLTLADEVRNIRGGVIVINGDIETNCSLDALVSQHRNELSGRVAEKLLG